MSAEKTGVDVIARLAEEGLHYFASVGDAGDIEYVWAIGKLLEMHAELLAAATRCIEVADSPFQRAVACSDRHDEAFNDLRTAVTALAPQRTEQEKNNT
jgi:hypothetical protein